jgi:hypothetical protein
MITQEVVTLRKNKSTSEVIDQIKSPNISPSRRVPIIKTHDVVLDIKMIIRESTQSPLNNLQGEKQDDIQRYNEIWESRLHGIIWENINQKNTINLKMKHPDQLLNPGKIITYDQALFLLLGLNPYIFALSPENWYAFTMLDYSPLKKIHDDKDLFHGVLNPYISHIPNWESHNQMIYFHNGINFCNSVEKYLFSTCENQALKESAFMQNGKIKSENLSELGDRYNFFQKPKSTNKKTDMKDDRRAKVINALVHFLTPKLKSKKIFTLGDIRTSKSFAQSLQENGLTLTDDEDANYQPFPNKDTILPSKLKDDLYYILKFNSLNKEHPNIRKLINYTPRIKKK